MILKIRIPTFFKKPETTLEWGGAGQTALPTSLLPAKRTSLESFFVRVL